VGRRFGEYELLEQLGRGGMGVVYKAHHLGLNRHVALKMVLDSKQDSARAIRRFQIEAEAAARLHHPHIVRLYEFGEEEEQHFFTMELIEGESLSRRMSRGEFRAGPGGQSRAEAGQRLIRATEMMVTMARAVHYAHERGVLHRDIKPGNILIDAQGRPHLTDFGLAKLSSNSATELSDSGGMAGTPAYMAPEQARGERLSRSADIYSLGTVFYELLTGKPPFSAATSLETLRLVTDQEPANPTTTTNGLIDADLATVCLKCLEKNPAARYASAQEFAEDLERWLKHEPIRARPASPGMRLRRWVRRNPVGASFIAVLLIGLATTGALIHRVWEGRKLVDEQNALIRESLKAKVNGFWERQEDVTEVIPSEEIAALLQISRSGRHGQGPPLRLRLSQSVPDSPMDQILKKGHGLAELEDRLSDILGRPVLIDMMLFKPQGGKVESLIRGDCDLKRMGALPYFNAKAIDSRLTPIARDAEEKEGVIYVRKNSDIVNLSQLVGKRLAFGDDDATISFQAKVELARAGILGTNLHWEHLIRKGSAIRRKRGTSDHVERPGVGGSHVLAIKAVLAGDYDAGVGRLQYVQDFTKERLRILHRFKSSPNFWVASSAASNDVVRAIRQALTEHGPTRFTVGPRATPGSSRFVPIDDSYFDEARRAMTNEVAQFEGNRPVQSRLGSSQSEEDDE
jgi:serine/threonine protein kinase/ABC-type phosphate/phosphonate transport system substrate-binding protein